MTKSSIFAGVAAALLLSVGTAQAADDMTNMEKCRVIKDGKGMIKEGKGACQTSSSSCAGNNAEGDPEAWIMVPKGECDKINKGDLSGVSDEVKDKLKM